jgi:hypothetical protein
MSIFKKKPSAQKMSMEFSNAICINATYETNKVISMVLGNDLNLEQYIKTYLEIVIYEIHIVDKMASKLYGSNFRSEFVNSIIDNAKLAFIEAQNFDGFCDNKDYFFEEYYHNTFHIYPYNGSILGNDPTQVTHFLATRLSNILLEGESEAKCILAETYIYEMLESFVKEILSKKPLKNLVGKGE